MGKLRRLRHAVALIALAIGAAPCLAQSRLSSPVETVDEPIAMSYGEVGPVRGMGRVSLTYFQGTEKVRQIEQQFEGILSARLVGEDLELSITNRINFAITDESDTRTEGAMTCLMRTTGESLGCEPEGGITYPIYGRPNYKTGDAMELRLGTMNDASLVANGRVRGKSNIDGRPVLVVDFAEDRQEKMQASVVHVVIAGFAYLDLATGHPVQMELTMDIRGSFHAHDRMLLQMWHDFNLAGD